MNIHINRCRAAHIYRAVKMPLPTPKTGCLWMRIQNKDWWEVVLLHFTVAEWKESFIMTGHAFIQHFIQKEEPLVPGVIRQYTISASLHMRSPFSFGFQSDRVFTFTLNRIRKGINHPLQSDLNLIPIELNLLFCLIELAIWLQTDYLVACKCSH